MSPKKRFKLLLDEMLPSRSNFPLTNYSHDLKHLVLDMNKSGITDLEVAKLAKFTSRIIITRNIKDYLPLAEKFQIDVFGVSPYLVVDDLDKLLISKLRKWPKYSKGRFEVITPSSKPSSKK